MEELRASRDVLSTQDNAQIYSISTRKESNEAGNEDDEGTTRRKPGSPCFKSCLPPIAFFILVLVLVIFFGCPIPRPQIYHVQLFPNCMLERGFPIVSATEKSDGGSICVEGMTPWEIFHTAQVIFKSLMYQKNGLVYKKGIFLVGRVGSYFGCSNNPVSTPYLHPSCKGNESNLLYCDHEGLAVNIPSSCHGSMVSIRTRNS